MRGGVATLTLSLSQRERAMSTLPLWGRDRERDCYVAQAFLKDGEEIAEKSLSTGGDDGNG
jgi:hypothetical protein